jgi:hypothetical protein
MKRPVIKVTSASVKYAEIGGIVTIGEETAKLLSEKLGREVLPGEKFNLGTLAIYHKNPVKRLVSSLKIKKHIFN